MESKNLLEALNVSPSNLSKQGQSFLKQLSEIAELLQMNPNESNIELALSEFLLNYESSIASFNTEAENLNKSQELLKETFLIHNSLKNIGKSPLENTGESPDLIKSLQKETKELKNKVDSQTKGMYSQEIDHKNLLKLSDECEGIAKELVSLQEKNELYGDFPTVLYI